MMERRTTFLAVTALLALFTLAGCALPGAIDDPLNSLRGRILLWHAWNDTEAASLEEALSRFEETQSDATIMVQTFDSEAALLREYRLASNAGLGPDILLGPSSWVRTLRDDGLLAEITDKVSQQRLNAYSPAAVTSLTYADGLYGVPQALDTMVLYYKREQVESPARTLAELLEQAADGNVVVMGTGFQDAFWGIQAFGGQLFDEDGRVILDQGGFANWLSWLKNAREAPGMILDTNREALYERFVEDGVAYYIGRSSELGPLTEALGRDVIGVAPLPSGPNGPAGPLLDVQALYFSPVSSTSQSEMALDLALFLTNAEQSGALMRDTRHVPANAQVRINPRLNPLVNSLAIQAQTAVPLLPSARIDAVWQVMSDLYPRALEGVLDPAEAAAEATTLINEANGISQAIVVQPGCDLQGTVRLAVIDDERAFEFYRDQAKEFASTCANVEIQVDRFAAADFFATQLAAADPNVGDDHEAYTLILANQALLPPLAEGGAIQPLYRWIDPELLQRFRPIAVDGLRFEEALYGLPAYVNTSILYYDRSAIESPARTLTDLLTQGQLNVPIVININAADAYWGIGAFGGTLTPNGAADDTDVDLFTTAFADWLTWLSEAESMVGITLERDTQDANRHFLADQSVYYVGDALALDELTLAKGIDRLGVTHLPSGPDSAAQPLVETSGFLFSSSNSAEQNALALAFAEEMTTVATQEEQWNATRRLPANAGVEVSDDTVLAIFLQQLASTVGNPSRSDMKSLLYRMNESYDAVFQQGVDPAEAAASLRAALLGSNGDGNVSAEN